MIVELRSQILAEEFSINARPYILEENKQMVKKINSTFIQRSVQFCVIILSKNL